MKGVIYTMNVFKNVERRVESTSFNKKELKKIDMISESAISNQALRRIARQDKLDMVNYQIAAKEHADKINARLESLSKQSITESQITNKISTIGSDYKLNIFKDIVFEVFSNALVLDADFVHENQTMLKQVTDNFIDSEGGFKLLENAINDTDSVLLKKMKKSCESLSNDIVKRIIKESKETVDDFNFNLNNEEEEKLDYIKGDLDADKLSELVKDKVLTVVRDEKENQTKNDELVADIENELVDDEDVVDNDTIDEAVSKIVLNNNILHEATLFNAILQDTYENILAENMAITSTVINNAERNDDMVAGYDVDSDSTEYEDVSDDQDETSIDELDGIDKNLVLENANTVDMDVVMAEALVKYTLMETMYTLKLKDYTYNDIKKMTDNISNRHITKAGPITESVGKHVESEEFVKARAIFFKDLQNLKNKKNIDKSKAEISKIVNNCDDNIKDDMKNLCKIGIDKLKEEKEKNPQFAKDYDEYIEFLKGF